MRITEKRAVSHFLTRHPKDWSFKQLIDHLSYDYDISALVTPKAVYEDVCGEELADLIVRFAKNLEGDA